MLIYILVVSSACVILPFLNGRIDLNVSETKQAKILRMGRLLQAYKQTANADYLQVAQVVAHELVKLGVILSPTTKAKLLGVY